MNAQGKINKLVLALNLKGVPVKIQRQMRYSKEKRRIVTSYIVFESHPKSDGEYFGSAIAILQYLAARYKEQVADDG